MAKIGVLIHEGKELEAGPRQLLRLLADRGHPDAAWRAVGKSRLAPDEVRSLVDDGIDRLLVWGGDGTVRRCIHTLLDAGAADHVEVAVLPAGTANLLARNLGVPITLDGALNVALGGIPKPIDVGLVNGEHFAVSGGAGFDGLLMLDVERSGHKRRWGRWAHLPAAWRNLRAPTAMADIEVDGTPWYRGPATLVLAANVGTSLGGLTIFPEARPDDGLLRLGVVRADTRLQWLRVLLAVLAGRTRRSRLGEVTSGRRIEVTLDRPLPWQIDGGDRPATTGFSYRILPGAIRVCTPALLPTSR